MCVDAKRVVFVMNGLQSPDCMQLTGVDLDDPTIEITHSFKATLVRRANSLSANADRSLICIGYSYLSAVFVYNYDGQFVKELNMTACPFHLDFSPVRRKKSVHWGLSVMLLTGW